MGWHVVSPITTCFRVQRRFSKCGQLSVFHLFSLCRRLVCHILDLLPCNPETSLRRRVSSEGLGFMVLFHCSCIGPVVIILCAFGYVRFSIPPKVMCYRHDGIWVVNLYFVNLHSLIPSLSDLESAAPARLHSTPASCLFHLAGILIYKRIRVVGASGGI